MAGHGLPRSPLAPEIVEVVPPVPGIALATGHAGIKYKDRDDLLLICCPPGATAAGVFTKSKTAAAPVQWCQLNLERSSGATRALLINAGNANAFTGAPGEEAVQEVMAATAQALGLQPSEILMASTGVIGQLLPAQKITAQVPNLIKALDDKPWFAAAKAIATTDTFPKLVSKQCQIGGSTITINGIAKGSGMIMPDMATMLAAVCTDARIPAELLQALLQQIVAISFNAITVDSDTSTNDSLYLIASGVAQHPVVESLTDPVLRDFKRTLTDVMIELAQLVVRDGEGAQKFITVHVTGAKSKADAKKVAMSIANSPLIKTAIAGEDANWGRIVMAAGKSGAAVDPDRLKVGMGGYLIAADGGVIPNYDESLVAAHIKTRDIEIDVDLGLGRSSFTAWTCDLTHGYISINADYRS